MLPGLDLIGNLISLKINVVPSACALVAFRSTSIDDSPLGNFT